MARIRTIQEGASADSFRDAPVSRQRRNDFRGDVDAGGQLAIVGAINQMLSGELSARMAFEQILD